MLFSKWSLLLIFTVHLAEIDLQLQYHEDNGYLYVKSTEGCSYLFCSYGCLFSYAVHKMILHVKYVLVEHVELLLKHQATEGKDLSKKRLVPCLSFLL